MNDCEYCKDKECDCNDYDWRHTCHERDIEIKSLKDQLAKSIKVIEFYANKENYRDNDLLGYPTSIIGDDQFGNEFGESKHLTVGGKRAREFLAELNNKKEN